MTKIIVNSNHINFKIEGEGEECLVFIHGICSDMSVWDKQVEFFAGKYKVITFDWKGHGSSEINVPGTSFDLETMASELSDILENLYLSDPYIIAADLSALVALKADIDDLVKSKGIISVNCADKMKFKTKYKAWKNMIAHIDLSMNKKLGMQACFSKIDRSNVEAWLQAASGANLEDESPYISTPVDFMYAKDNPFVSLEVIEESVSRIPNSRVFSLEKGGLFPMISDHVTFNAEVQDFIETYIPSI